MTPEKRDSLTARRHREDLAKVVRVMQWQTLAGIMYHLGDPGVAEYPSDPLPRANWALFEMTEGFQPLHPIHGLHESVLDTEPSDREMRPRGATREG